jgi:antitoxin ParD1/3/4
MAEARVASGEFASVEEAARQVIAERIAERALEDGDDMEWAKSYVEEALASSRSRNTKPVTTRGWPE